VKPEIVIDTPDALARVFADRFAAEARAAIREAVEAPDSQIPVALALRAARRALILVDPPAAGLLGRN